MAEHIYFNVIQFRLYWPRDMAISHCIATSYRRTLNSCMLLSRNRQLETFCISGIYWTAMPNHQSMSCNPGTLNCEGAMSFLMHNNTCLLFPTSMELSQWIGIHNSLAKTVRKAARVALGKDVSKVQHFVMSGQQK